MRKFHLLNAVISKFQEVNADNAGTHLQGIVFAADMFKVAAEKIFKPDEQTWEYIDSLAMADFDAIVPYMVAKLLGIQKPIEESGTGQLDRATPLATAVEKAGGEEIQDSTEEVVAPEPCNGTTGCTPQTQYGDCERINTICRWVPVLGG